MTEDYELGLLVKHLGRRSRFVRAVDDRGQLIATREYFPADLSAAVRQKARWIHGIAFQGWDRLGWSWGVTETWMRLRDRRGPLAALVLLIAYLVIAISFVLWAAESLGLLHRYPLSGLMRAVVLVGFAGLLWRAAIRFAFTTALYGVAEGLRSIPRLFVANMIAIVAARRAISAYLRTFRGHPTVWEKTHHSRYPAAETRRAISLRDAA